ncbi:MAG: DUF4340 domain-containing protein [Candidatus Eremiobacteraeota bacterium]|nr:DUF4340 domain-containing protein [Candidatus Eremiobacteraeota bacterium]
MSFKRTIVIVVLFILVGGFYYLYEIKGKPQREESKQKENAIFTIEEKDIIIVEMKRKPDKSQKDKETEEFIFEKVTESPVKKAEGTPSPKSTGKIESIEIDSYSWLIKKPKEVKGESSTIDLLARSIVNSSKEETVEESPADLKKYGLDDPHYILTVSDGKKKETLKIGGKTIDKKNFYAIKEGGKPVFLVNSGLSRNADKDLTGYRDKSVTPLKPEDIERVAVHLGKRTYLFQKDDKKWTLSSPTIPRLDENSVNKYVNGLFRIYTKEFFENTQQNRKLMGLEGKPDEMIMFFEKGKDEPLTLKISRPRAEKKLIFALLGNSDEIFGLPFRAGMNIDVNKEKLIKKSLLSFDANNLSEIQFNIKGKNVNLKREEMPGDKKKKDYKWVMISPEKKDTEIGKVDGIIRIVRNMYARDAKFIEDDLRQYGLDKPQLTITGKDDKGKDIFTFITGSESSDPRFRYVKVDDEKTVELVKKEAVDNLEKIIWEIISPPRKESGEKQENKTKK